MKVLFNIPHQSVSIEGDGPDLIKLLEVVRELAPGLPQITIQAQSAEQSHLQQKNKGRGGNGSRSTLRQFARKLHLNSNSEKIAAIAYHKKEVEDIETFTPKEMGDWFTSCGFKKPNQMPVAVHDARKRYDYIESTSRGKWGLTTNGLNLIVGKLNDNTEEE